MKIKTEGLEIKRTKMFLEKYTTVAYILTLKINDNPTVRPCMRYQRQVNQETVLEGLTNKNYLITAI